MKNLYKGRKIVALFYLLVFSIETFTPTLVFALTSGPSQPEISAFQPVSTNDMVDLFTGDFRYNIPLLDVGGYPVNLSYQSGATMDDEASWVGFGWNINPGAINRQVRGLPDDFKGSGPNRDYLEKTVNMKPQITKGLSLSTNKIWKIQGRPVGSSNYSVGFSYSNYSGIKATLSANAKIGASLSIGTSKTASLGLESLNISTDNQNGSTIGGNISLSGLSMVEGQVQSSKSTSFGFAYNSNAGLSELTLNPNLRDSRNAVLKYLRSNSTGSQESPGISFIGNDYIAPVELITKDKSTPFTLSLGAQSGPLFKGIVKVPGYYNKVSIPANKVVQRLPAFGMLYSNEGKNSKGALQDFNRENDRPYIKSMPNLPVPVVTPDLFNVSSQGFSGQFKLASSGSGIFASNDQNTKVTNFGLGVELGFGVGFQIGVPGAGIDYNENSSGKWRRKNTYEAIGDFKNPKPLQPAYFKKVGDLSASNASFFPKVGGDKAVKVNLKSNLLTNLYGTGESKAELKSNDGNLYVQDISKNQLEKQSTLFSYLTAAEAKDNGLDRRIKSYQPNIPGVINTNTINHEDRVSISDYRKPHHISEVTVTDKAGSRQVYGIPVYNITQQDISFSIKSSGDRAKGYTTYISGHQDVATGDDVRLKTKEYQYYYNKQVIPAYASSYLLTAMLSPDYVDVKNDGITDDDLGTAVNFNYSKVIDNYKWRTPTIKNNGTTAMVANYNEGLLQDSRDDKATISYGEKEVWYMHSIESKNMVAYFILNSDNANPRYDGLGVTDINGAINPDKRLRFLKEIRLYSKSELAKHKSNINDAVPVKTVHFEYNYELFNKLPNSSISAGKLTLKKIYFTFGVNNKGSLNPYLFNYNIPSSNIPTSQDYGFRQYDRWGNYKPESENLNGLNNSEFPYSTQNRINADLYAGYWQLKKIVLPSGGNMEVTYETDDYAYVQNKRASTMCFIKNIGVNAATNTTGDITQQNKIYIKLPKPVNNNTQLKDLYFQDMKYLYYKAYVDLDNKDHYEYVPGYALITGYNVAPGDNTTAEVTVDMNSGVNPISKSGWQLMRSSLQRLAYPESDNLESDDGDFVKAIKALVASLTRLKDLIENFDKRAQRKKFSSRIDVRKSWVRLCDPYLSKIGGGSRVKMIKVNDQWAEMTAGSNNNVESASYGQVYEYTSDNPFGGSEKVSSGVASYEPLLGNDENPFRQPVEYSQKRIFGLDNKYYLEQPLGESYFPGPVVGYSKVTVKNIGADESVGKTGSTTSEFYTAKDFPTIVEQTPLEAQLPKLSSALKLFGMVTHDQVTLSQGYVIINNDMHGKQKSEEIIDRGGQQISAVKYVYKTNGNAGTQRLQSRATVMRPGGIIDQSILGQDIDFYTDMAEHKTESFGVNGEPAFGVYPLGVFPKVWFYWGGFKPNYHKKLYRAAVAIKTIHITGILEKVIKIEKGSRIESENLVWDAETGDVLLTKTQNEFDDPVYSFTYPAHWKYERMGPAYRNQGLYLEKFQSGANGEILSTQYGNYLFPGDEIMPIRTSIYDVQNKYWIIESGNNVKRVIDSEGRIVQLNSTTIKVLRSGCRNMSSSPLGTLISLSNPINGNHLDITSLTKVLNANSAEYTEQWTMPVRLTCSNNCPSGYEHSVSGCRKVVTTSSPCVVTNLCATQESSYGVETALYDQVGTTNHTRLYGPLWESNGIIDRGPLNRSGVRFCDNNSTGRWLGTSAVIVVPQTKVYYIGLSGDNRIRLRINGNPGTTYEYSSNLLGQLDYTHNSWRIIPVSLNAGENTFEIFEWNLGGPAALGCEVYNVNRAELIAATSLNDLHIIFSSKSITQSPFVYFDQQAGDCIPCSTGSNYDALSNSCMRVETAPFIPKQSYFNPYLSGILGSWRLSTQSVYDVNRESFIESNSSTNIRKSGYYTSFQPYWAFSGSWLTKNTSNGVNRWKTTNTVSLLDRKGQEIENVNALGQYTSAVFGYQETLPVGVASNAQQREIGFDGFEDYSFDLGSATTDTCYTLKPHFSFKDRLLPGQVELNSAHAHSGNYSLAISAPVTLVKKIINRPPPNFYFFDAAGQYSVASSFEDYMKGGFMPLPNKQYVISFWVKEGSATNSSTNMVVKINNSVLTPTTNPAKKWPMVEGWKRIEIPFLNSAVNSFKLELIPSGTTYIDDIRIFPADGQMKSFVYDANTQKLMAQLDENNFTSFYEYDDEGTLIRLKKETEKGIMTIRETRSHYKRN